MNSSYI